MLKSSDKRNASLTDQEQLILLPLNEYIGVDRDDPIRQYEKPFFGKYYRRRVEMCLARCKGGERVLEVGFGSGVAFPNLAKKYKEVHGIDLKANSAEIAALFASKGIKVFLRQGDLLKLPYEENYFDTVLLISILEHLQPEDQDTAFQEIRRVLKPGGQVVYGTPVDSRTTRFGFLLLGYDIRNHHFSNQRQIWNAAAKCFKQNMLAPLSVPFLGVRLYEVGDFTKG